MMERYVRSMIDTEKDRTKHQYTFFVKTYTTYTTHFGIFVSHVILFLYEDSYNLFLNKR